MRTRWTIEKMQQLAAKHGGLCLSTTYQGLKTPLEWQCAQQHRWMLSPKRVKIGKWCRECVVELQHTDRLLRLQTIAKRHGGLCLSTTYQGLRTPLEWQCAQQHRWMSSPQTIERGYWCRRCVVEAYRADMLKKLQDIARQHGG